MPSFAITVNGKRVTADVDADTPLLWVLRDDLSPPVQSTAVESACVAPAPFMRMGTPSVPVRSRSPKPTASGTQRSKDSRPIAAILVSVCGWRKRSRNAVSANRA